MAIDINSTYPGRVNPPDADYPTGSVKNETVPESSNDGTPLDQAWGNDVEGHKQALLLAAGLAASNNPETAVESQMLQGIIQQAMGRAFNFDDSGAANAYVAEIRTNQQAPMVAFDGMRITIPPSADNTGASTLDISKLLGETAGTTVIDIKLVGGVDNPAAGDISTSSDAEFIYRTSPGVHAELKNPQTASAPAQLFKYTSGANSIVAGGAITLNHGLGGEPDDVSYVFECTTAEYGYSIGDRIIIDPTTPDFSRVNTSEITATQIIFQVSNQANIANIATKGTGVLALMTNANWDLYIKAVRYV